MPLFLQSRKNVFFDIKKGARKKVGEVTFSGKKREVKVFGKKKGIRPFFTKPKKSLKP